MSTCFSFSSMGILPTFLLYEKFLCFSSMGILPTSSSRRSFLVSLLWAIWLNDYDTFQCTWNMACEVRSNCHNIWIASRRSGSVGSCRHLDNWVRFFLPSHRIPRSDLTSWTTDWSILFFITSVFLCTASVIVRLFFSWWNLACLCIALLLRLCHGLSYFVLRQTLLLPN